MIEAIAEMPAGTLFGWMTPGEARLFGLDELQKAKDWVAG